MNTTDEILEYELLDISFEADYEQPEGDLVWRVGEDEVTGESEIEYDADGIPMGNSLEEYKKRQDIITNFLRQWGEANAERKVRNEALDDDIFIRGISVIEAKEHSAKRYKSTKALLILDEILQKAKPVGRVPVKKDNKNQRPFAYMLIMVYKHEELGTIKLTVGVNPTEQRIQYGITALDSGQPLIDKRANNKSKKKKRSPR